MLLGQQAWWTGHVLEADKGSCLLLMEAAGSPMSLLFPQEALAVGSGAAVVLSHVLCSCG